MKRQFCRFLLIAGVLSSLPLANAAARSTPPILADVSVLMRDDQGRPLPGVDVKLTYQDPMETKKVKTDVARNTGTSDDRGIATARAYVGWKEEAGNLRKIEEDRVMVTATKEGYQPFQGAVPFFYIATRAGDRLTIYLHDIMMMPKSSMADSHIVPLSLNPIVSVDPPYGDSSTQFTVTVKVDTPEVLAKTIDKSLFRVGLMQNSADPKKPDMELVDDGKSPDKTKEDGVFTSPIRPPLGQGTQVIDNLAVIIRPRDDFNSLMWKEGVVYNWTETKRTMSGLSLYTRWVSVRANVVKVPVKWVVADDLEKAKLMYRERFGVPWAALK